MLESACPTPSVFRGEWNMHDSGRASHSEIVCRHREERRVRRSSTSEGGSDEAIHSFFLSLRGKMDCFAEPVIGRAFARPLWLAMTNQQLNFPWLFENRIGNLRKGVI